MVMLWEEVSRVTPLDLRKVLLRFSRKVVDEAEARRVPPLRLRVAAPEPSLTNPEVVSVPPLSWTVPLPPVPKR